MTPPTPSPLAALLVLFTRLDPPAAIAHPARAAILARLRAQPGMTVGEVARAGRVDYKTAVHHVRTLERFGCVRLVADGRRRRLFLPGGPREAPPPPRVLQALAALRDGPAGPAGLGRRLDIPRGTAGSILDLLSRLGHVESAGAGQWRLTAEGEALLASSPLT